MHPQHLEPAHALARRPLDVRLERPDQGLLPHKSHIIGDGHCKL